MKYRKKPIVIEAVQFNGRNLKECLMFIGIEESSAEGCAIMGLPLIITTLEGDMAASKGDYIIKGVKGEFYPCKPDIFEASYEPV